MAGPHSDFSRGQFSGSQTLARVRGPVARETAPDFEHSAWQILRDMCRAHDWKQPWPCQIGNKLLEKAFFFVCGVCVCVWGGLFECISVSKCRSCSDIRAPCLDLVMTYAFILPSVRGVKRKKVRWRFHFQFTRNQQCKPRCIASGFVFKKLLQILRTQKSKMLNYKSNTIRWHFEKGATRSGDGGS